MRRFFSYFKNNFTITSIFMLTSVIINLQHLQLYSHRLNDLAKAILEISDITTNLVKYKSNLRVQSQLIIICFYLCLPYKSPIEL